MTDTSPAPAGATFTSVGVQPYLIVRGGAAALDFYRDAFGAVEDHRLVGDDGRIGHAEILIGASRLALADEHPEMDIVGPATLGGTSVSFTIDVTDADAAHARAVRAGATSLDGPSDRFYGLRAASVLDPFGHRWTLHSPLATLTTAEYASRAAEGGYTLVGTPAMTHGTSVDHQVKHHEQGDLYYFTIPVGDLARAQAFFGAVLGWRFDEEATPGHISNISAPPGGLRSMPGESAPVLWFVVPDIHAAVATVRELGGTAEEPVMHDSGWSADCTDDQGTKFSLSVPAPKYTR